MNNKSLILAFIIISTNFILMSAQTIKGRFLIGEFSYIEQFSPEVTGSMNIGFTKMKSRSDSDNMENSDSDKRFSINLVPKVGYFVIDNLAVGLDLSLSTTSMNSSDGDYKSNSTWFAVGPFIRYYIPSKKVLPFAEANYSIGSQVSNTEFYDEEFTSKDAIQLYGIGLGLAIPIGEKVAFDAIVGYHAFVNKAKEDNENNERLVVGTVGLKLGFVVFLGNEKNN